VVGIVFGTSFVGRDAELGELGRLLQTRQLVTVVGEGGVGKTRLARQVVGELSDAAWPVFWIDLGAATGLAGVRASFEDAVGPAGRDASFEGLIEERVPLGPCLLAIDNCEQVLDDVATSVGVIAELRPDARMLATSRIRLGVNGEVVFRLTPLVVPSPDATLARAREAASVALLVDRLRDVVTDFELDAGNVDDVIEVARRTEGVPLAIELVAAAAGALPLAEIVRSVPDLRELGAADTRREPRRHRSLDASVRWSVDRLGVPVGVAFRRLGVFADSFCFASAVRVISDDGDREDRAAARSFVELVEASLVRRLPDDRYGLPMAVRTFAQDELDTDPEAATIRDRHADIVHDLVAEAAAGLRNGVEADESWLRLLDLELPEIRSAVDWQRHRGRPGRAADLLLETYDHAHVRGRYSELLAQCRTILADPGLERSDGVRIASAASTVSVMAGRVADSYDFATRAVLDSADPAARSEALIQRAWSGFFSGRLDTSTMWTDLDEALRLARELRDDELYASALLTHGSLVVHARSIPEGRQLLDTAKRSGSLTPSHRVLSARLFALYGVAVFDLELDELFDRAVQLIDDCRSAGHVAFESMALATAGTIAALRSDADRADEYLDEAERLTRRHELPTFSSVAQRWRAFAHYRFERPDALDQAERAIEIAAATGNEWDVAGGHWLVGLLLLRGGDDGAGAHLLDALNGSIDPYYPSTRSRAELGLALLDLRNDAFTAGLARVHDALGRSHDYGDLLGVASALDHLARFECERSAFDRAGRFAGAADAIHSRAIVARLPCERDLRALVEHRLVEGVGVEAARRIIEEGRSLDPIAAVLLARRSRGRRSRPVSGWSSLTPTEREVAGLAADGLTNPAIAGRLLMSANTVKTHLSHVYAKTGVPGRSGLAAAWARRSIDS
jgi:predicted ATPase/DNA-binding CsgD family transcriptional regulator